MVLPGVIACYEFFVARQQSSGESKKLRSGSLVAAFSAYILLIGMYFIVRAQILHGVAHNISDVGVSTSLLSLPWIVYFYVSQMLVPVALGPFYDVHYVTGFSLELLVIPLVVISAFVAVVWWWSR